MTLIQIAANNRRRRDYLLIRQAVFLPMPSTPSVTLQTVSGSLCQYGHPRHREGSFYLQRLPAGPPIVPSTTIQHVFHLQAAGCHRPVPNSRHLFWCRSARRCPNLSSDGVIFSLRGGSIGIRGPSPGVRPVHPAGGYGERLHSSELPGCASSGDSGICCPGVEPTHSEATFCHNTMGADEASVTGEKPPLQS